MPDDYLEAVDTLVAAARAVVEAMAAAVTQTSPANARSGSKPP